MILPSWQIKHPHRTIDEAIDLDEIPDLQYRYLLQKLVSDQALANPVAAVAFAMRLEDEEIRVEMVSGVVESWAIKDPAGAGQWAAALPEGEIRDLGLSKVSERLAITDLDSARELVREIGDRRTKGFAVHRMMTAGRVIKHHFEAGLRLADEEMSEMPYDLLHAWALYIRPEDTFPHSALGWKTPATPTGSSSIPTINRIKPSIPKRLTESSSMNWMTRGNESPVPFLLQVFDRLRRIHA